MSWRVSAYAPLRALERQNLNPRPFTAYAECLAKILVLDACRLAEISFVLAATTSPGQHEPISDAQRDLADEHGRLHQEMALRGEEDQFLRAVVAGLGYEVAVVCASLLDLSLIEEALNREEPLHA